MYWCVYIGTAMVVLILNYLKSAHSIFSRLQTCRRIDARFQLLQKGVDNMKKHENIIIIVCLIAVIGLTAIVSGLGYAAARSKHSQEGKCPCDAAIVNMANRREISHYYAACYVEREIRLGYSSGDLDFIESCRKWHAEREF